MHEYFKWLSSPRIAGPTMRWVIAAVLMAEIVAAQIAYPNFSSTAGLALNGSASQLGVTLRLTPAVQGQAGTAWATNRQPVAAGFQCQFTFRISPSGSDGLTFILHDDPAGPGALGAPGGNLAYGSNSSVGPMRNLLAVELDTYPNNWNQIPDLSGNELSVHLCPAITPNQTDEINSLGRTTPSINFSDGSVHSLTLAYQPGTLDIFLDTTVAPTLSVSVDLGTGGTNLNGSPIGGLTLNPGGAYVGFTGATGGGVQTNEVLSWTFSSTPPTPQYQTNSFAASLDVDGVLGSQQMAAVVTLPIGTTANLTLLSWSVGQAWDLGAGLAPLVPASAGAPTTSSGQIVNLDLSDPNLSLWFNFLQGPTWGPSTSLSFPFAFPFSTSISAQMIVVAPAMSSGVALSQPVRVIVL